MSVYTDHVGTGESGHWGLGLGLEGITSDVFGHFGLGVTLATNFVLVLVDSAGLPADAGTPYTLAYTDPTDGPVTRTLAYNPGVPFQDTLPENTPITFALGDGTRYAAGQTATAAVAPGSVHTLRVALTYPPGSYAVVRRRFLR